MGDRDEERRATRRHNGKTDDYGRLIMKDRRDVYNQGMQ